MWLIPGPLNIGDSKLVGEDRVNEAINGIEKELIRKAMREEKKKTRKLKKQKNQSLEEKTDG